MLAKTLVELPSHMAFAALFGVVVKQQCGLRAKTADISAAYALTAAASASLGLAIGRGGRADGRERDSYWSANYGHKHDCWSDQSCWCR